MEVNRDTRITQHNSNPVHEAFDQLIQSAKRLMRRIIDCMDQSHDYEVVSECLSAVPLSTTEYALAAQRLANARQYAAEGERGAAQYEVTMLARGVAKALLPR